MNRDYVDNLRVRQFVELLTTHQPRIHSYVLSLVPNFNDADDIMQDTSKMMWNKFEEFHIGTDFLAWGMRIAFFRVMEYRRNRKKNKAICFDQALFQELDKSARLRQDRSAEYLTYLRECMQKLPNQDRRLVHLRYQENFKVKDIARHLERSVQSIYQKLAKIHDVLLMCVQRTASLKES